MRQPFYVVWNPSTGYTKFQHPNKPSADNEAKRLALEHPGQEFVVLAPVSSFKKVEVQAETFDYQNDPEIPF